MWSVFKEITSVLLTVILMLSGLFTTGALPETGVLPDAEPGVYGQYVNTFVGTGGYPWVAGNMFPGAAYPFGAVKLSPDSVLAGGENLFSWATGGYHYSDTHILGFSHTRLSGTGAQDMGHFRITPAVGNTDPATRISLPILISHDEEVSTAGYYAINLSELNCLAELTVSEHTGVHRYTFNTKKDAHIFLDTTSFIGGNGSAYDGEVIIEPDTRTVTGAGTVKTGFTGRYGGLRAYFAAEFNLPFESYSVWADGESSEGVATAAADDCGANLNFGNIYGEPLEIKLAISFVSLENARENLAAETSGLDFEGVRAQTRNTWDNMLSKIDIETDDEENKTNFYTAMYHSMIMPTTYTDVNGEYLGFNKTIGTAEGYTYRSDMSLWDTYRTTHPLYTLIAPEIQYDCVKSLINMAQTGGVLPRWPSGGGYTGSMFGSPADMVLAETYLKGLTDFDVEEAYKYMVKTSEEKSPEGTDGRSGIDEYNTYGYVPADATSRSVSYTLEYAWADNSIALLAQELGKTEDVARYTEKAGYYKNLWNSDSKYFRARNLDGSWVEPFSPEITSFYDEVLPIKFARAYTEGSARHWRWAAPYDADGLIGLFGSTDYFVSELEDFMADASADRAALDPGSGFWIGNEHDMHAPYLFIDAGEPALTQKWVRWTLTERFSSDVDGIDGNEDGGALSSWYVLSALGIYPVAGTAEYWIGAPIADKATVSLGGGKTLTVIAENQSAENMYVQSVTLNGVRLTQAKLVHSQIADGGTLTFVMGSEPAENGGY